MSTLLLSYPGEDFRSQSSIGPSGAAGAARLALREWLALCDQIARAGGRILVLDPAPAGASQLVHAGCLGAIFNSPGKLPRPTFLHSRGSEAPAVVSEDPACRLLAEAGLDVRVASAQWQGQVDLIPLERNRFLLCHGGASTSSRQAADELRQVLPMGAQVLEVELAPGIARGVQAVQYVVSPGGSPVLLCHRAGLRSHTPEQLGRFAGGHVEVIGLGTEDVEAHAAECLVVHGHCLLAPGSSTILRGQLARRGFQIEEANVSHLVGANGPRLLALDLPGLVLAEDSPSYANRRAEIVQRLDRYPE